MVFHQKGRVSKLAKRVSISLALFALIVQPFVSINASTASAAIGGCDAINEVHNQAELELAAGDTAKTVICFANDIVTNKQINISHDVNIYGLSKRLLPAFAGGSNNDSALAITGGHAVISNLVVDGIASTNTQGIQVWKASAALDDVTVRNNDRAGLHSNGSNVTVTNITTENNGANYGGILLDKGRGVPNAPKVTINGQSHHVESSRDIYRDQSGSIVDSNSQYTQTLNVLGWQIWRLKPAPAAPSIITPSQDSVLTSSNDVDFTWGSVSGAATYDINVDGAVSTGHVSTSYSKNLANGLHAVQVRSVTLSGLEGPWSSERTFTVNTYNYAVGDSEFRASEVYIRENNGTDKAAFMRVPAPASAVRTTFTGPTTVTLNAVEHIQAGQWPNATGAHQYRATAALPAGVYNVTAEYLVGSTWYAVSGGPAKLYVLANPTFDVVYPNDTRNVFRPNDRAIVRIKADDTNKVFNDVVFKINGVNYTVGRSDCDLRQEGNYVLCDVTAASSWSPLSTGTYTATVVVGNKANGHTTKTSREFTIDDQGPQVTNFTVPESAAKSLAVSAEASDNIGVDTVTFWIANPNDAGECKNNLPALMSINGVLEDGKYTANFDTSSLNGKYCVLVSARDTAASNSTPIFASVTIDSTDPIVQIIGYDEDLDGYPVIYGTVDDADATVTVSINGETFDADVYTEDGVTVWVLVLDEPLYPGDYTIVATAKDKAGNTSSSTDSFTVDEPVVIDEEPIVPEVPRHVTPVVTPASVRPGVTSRVIAQIAASQTDDGDNAQASNREEVLGEQTNRDGDTAPVAQPTAEGWKIGGLLWYWWLLIVAAIAAAWWLLAAIRRRGKEEA